MPPHERELPDLPDLPLMRYAEYACPHCGVIPAWPTATRTLRAYAQLAAALAYFPTITSGYRCPWYNATVPGATRLSLHQTGGGLDLAGSIDQLLHIADLAQGAGFTWTRIDPEKGYVHLDTR